MLADQQRQRAAPNTLYTLFTRGNKVLALRISVPAKGTTINAAIADHVPVAELIPHLVDAEPGEHWVLHRAVGHVAPQHTLAEAGVRPGESLTLQVATVPAPPAEAVEELSGPIPTSPAAWIAAAIVSLFSLQAAPAWHPLDNQLVGAGGVLTLNNSADTATIVATAVAALAAAAASLHHRNFSYLAAILGFGLGLHVNVLCACFVAALLVWRSGPARIVTVTWVVFAAVNLWPGITLLLAMFALAYSGQIAIGLAGIKLPKVPATGVFTEPTTTRAGQVVEVHSSLVVAIMAVLGACIYQLAPWGESLDLWTAVLLVMVAVLGVSARSTRPVHSVALAVLSATTILWLGLHEPWGPLCLVLVGLPALRVQSPMLGRAIDMVEAIAFCLAIPLALHTTGLFDAIRGIG